MRDPDLVFRAQRAASALERAWQRWRTVHGQTADPTPVVSSYVGYSLEDPWGQPRVVLGLAAQDAEQLAVLLDKHDCVGPVHALVGGRPASGRAVSELSAGGLSAGEDEQAPAIANQARLALAGRSPGGDDRDGPVFRQVTAAAKEAAAARGADVILTGLRLAPAAAGDLEPDEPSETGDASEGDEARTCESTAARHAQEEQEDTNEWDAESGEDDDEAHEDEAHEDEAHEDEAYEDDEYAYQDPAGAIRDGQSGGLQDDRQDDRGEQNGYPAGFDREAGQESDHPVGNDAAGYDAAGYEAPGTNVGGHDVPGHDVPGYDAVGYDAPGTNAAGYDTPGTHAADYDPLGHDAVGSDAVGDDAVEGTGVLARFGRPYESEPEADFAEAGDWGAERGYPQRGEAGPLALAASTAQVEAEARIRAALLDGQWSDEPDYPYSGGSFDVTDPDLEVGQDDRWDAAPETNYAKPGYREPAFSEPGYGEAGYTEPGYGEAGYTEPGYGEAGYTEPGYHGNGRHAAAGRRRGRGGDGRGQGAAGSEIQRYPGDELATRPEAAAGARHRLAGVPDPAYLDEEPEHGQPDEQLQEPQDHQGPGYARRNRITRGYSIPRLSRTKRSGVTPGA